MLHPFTHHLQVLVGVSAFGVCGVVAALWGVAGVSTSRERAFLFFAAGFCVLAAAWFVMAAFTFVWDIRNGFFVSIASGDGSPFGLPLIFVQRAGTIKV
jgi:hypothetical protein